MLAACLLPARLRAFIESSPNEAPGDHRLMVVELKVAGCANPLGAEG